jgi:hypothetical protein
MGPEKQGQYILHLGRPLALELVHVGINCAPFSGCIVRDAHLPTRRAHLHLETPDGSG